MIPKAILCPSCGSDDIDAAIGAGRICLNCGHTFEVIDGKVQNFSEDDDDEDTGRHHARPRR